MGHRRAKARRGVPSSIDRLPEDVRVEVNAKLRDRRLTQQEILGQVNPVLIERGEPLLSRSALSRYAVAVEEKGAMMREAREAADAMVGGLGEHAGTDLGRAVTEMVKTLVFDLVARAKDGDQDAIGVDTLGKVALIAQRIERASKISLEREIKIIDKAKKEALEKAAATAEATAKQAGVSDATIAMIRRDVLRMAD